MVTGLDAEHRESLLDALAAVLGRHGWRRLVRGRLVLPTTEHFPEPIEKVDPETVRAVARRLFDHAGIGPERVTVLVDDYRDEVPGGFEPNLALPEVAFDAVDGSAVRFHLIRNGIAEWLVHVLAHQVATALRTRPDLAAPPPAGIYREAAPANAAEDVLAVEEDERGTSLTAFAYGFGPIVARGTQLYRVTEELRGTRAVAQYSSAAVGGLTEEEASFLLAAQLVARGEEAGEAVSVLDPLRADAVYAYIEELGEVREHVLARLGLPPESEWPPREEEPRAIVSLPPLPAPSGERRPEAKRPRNAGRPVRRVPAVTTGKLARDGARIGVALGAVGALAAIQSGAWVVALGGVAASVVVPALWAGIGTFFRAHHCSDPECDASIPPGAAECPRCGGRVTADPGSSSGT